MPENTPKDIPIPPVHRELSQEDESYNEVSNPDEMRKKKLRILIIFVIAFLAVNTIIFCILIFMMLSAGKDSQSAETPENAVAASAETSDAEGKSTAQDAGDSDAANEKDEEANKNAPAAKKAPQDEIDEDLIPPLNAKDLAHFEDSFFDLFDECTQIGQKERLLFAFMVLHVYFSEEPEKLELFDGCLPSAFLKKFSQAIGDDSFALLPPDELSDSEKQEKTGDLLRIAGNVKKKISSNRDFMDEDSDYTPSTFHFEIFSLVKSNPNLKIYLHKAIEKFEKRKSNN